MAGHGRLYLVLAKSVGLKGFSATFLVFRDVVSDCICSLPESRSIRQSSRVDWLVSFSKMTNILWQCPLGIVFRRRQIAMQPNQSDGSLNLRHTPRHLHLRLNARQLRSRHICACAALELQHCCTTASPWEKFTCAGNNHGPWWSFLCLLMSSVLELPLNCVGEPCMMLVGDITIQQNYLLQAQVCLHELGACASACVSHLN